VVDQKVENKLDLIHRNAEKIKRTKQYEQLRRFRGPSPAFDKNKIQARVGSFNTNYHKPKFLK
jgi:hypothetical protein